VFSHRSGQRHRPRDGAEAGADGAELFLTDRNAEGLEQTVADARALGATVSAHRALDVSDYEQVAAFAADIHSAHPSMDVVMNIAGVSAWGTVSHLTHQHWESMVSINLMGPIHVIETFIPPMVAAGRGGHLVNVSSAAGLVALPWHAAYSASKYGLRGLSEVLRFDLARHGIGVSVVVPGAVKTPLVQTVEIAGVDRQHPQVRKWIDRFSGHAVSPELAADKILRGVTRNRYLVYTSNDIARCTRSSGSRGGLQRRDATGERHLHPRTAADQERLIPGALISCPSPMAGWSAWFVR